MSFEKYAIAEIYTECQMSSLALVWLNGCLQKEKSDPSTQDILGKKDKEVIGGTLIWRISLKSTILFKMNTTIIKILI